MYGNMKFHTPMAHDPAEACDECGMPGDLCTCDAMEMCDEDYCKDYEPSKSKITVKKRKQ